MAEQPKEWNVCTFTFSGTFNFISSTIDLLKAKNITDLSLGINLKEAIIVVVFPLPATAFITQLPVPVLTKLKISF
jgi:hypothetical protein